MTTETWKGGVGSWTDPNQWSGGTAPQAGDTLFVPIGTANVANQVLLGENVVLGPAPYSSNGDNIGGYGNHEVLNLDNVVLGNLTFDDGGHGGSDTEYNYPTVNVSGALIADGSITDDHLGYIKLNFAHGSVMINNGPINVGSGRAQDVDLSGDATNWVVNNSVIKGPELTIGPNLSGGGTVEIDDYPAFRDDSNCEIQNWALGGQTFLFDPNPPQVPDYSVLTIDHPNEFQALIAGFQAGDTVVLAGLQETSAQYNAGVLTLFNGYQPEAWLHFAGVNSLSDFNIAQNNSGLFITHS
jgi:hypothetical protein